MAANRGNGGVGRKLAAAVLAAVAAKLALRLLEGIWTKGIGKDVPEDSLESTVSEKVIWVALAAAAVAAARELTKEIVNPKSPASETP